MKGLEILRSLLSLRMTGSKALRMTKEIMLYIVGQIMKILQRLKTMIAARGLEVLLLGKEVTMPDGVSLGVVARIKKELPQDKIYMVVDNQGQESIIPIEQIISVANKVVLFDDLMAGLVADGDSRGFG